MAIFNRVRKAVIEEKNIRKYIFYAIGEIIIVVLGIFIAIQLNNYNANRITQNKTKIIFEEIKTELQLNIKTCDFLIDWYAGRDSLIQLVKDRKVTYEMYKNNSELISLINYYSGVNLQSISYIKLSQNLDAIPKEYKNVFKMINELYLFDFPGADKYLDVMASFNERMHERWALNYSWFSEPRDIVNIEERIDFYLNDPRYINDVRLYSMYSKDNYVRTLKRIRDQADKILIEIGKIK